MYPKIKTSVVMFLLTPHEFEKVLETYCCCLRYVICLPWQNNPLDYRLNESNRTEKQLEVHISKWTSKYFYRKYKVKILRKYVFVPEFFNYFL